MKRLLLLPILLLTANAANSERILLKCTHERTLEDQSTTTETNEFSLDTDRGSIAWINVFPIDEKPNRLYETPYAFNTAFEDPTQRGTIVELDINRMDGSFRLEKISGWASKGPVVEGQCTKVDLPQRLF